MLLVVVLLTLPPRAAARHLLVLLPGLRRRGCVLLGLVLLIVPCGG